ncbi:copper amine oxidase [Bacillus pinisoli]|uniref:copper amine oxidase n=1 Tax=Bacillus pinisoli TaxID=2901866 RepID=UPI001FF5F3FD|nr:copper amine oxidase [Bacillus pinisoli]
MNIKKSLVAVPLSLSLLFPTVSMVHAQGSDGHAHAQTPTVTTPASDLRAALDALLSEHAYLAVVAMQKGIDGKGDFEAAAGALSENTDSLTAAVTSFYGEEGGAAFKEIWSSHIGYFVDYVKATGANDQAAKDKALAELDEYRVEQAAFFDSATGSRLKASELEEGLKVHINQLLWAFDNYVSGDFDKAYDSVRESIHHMYGFGKGLSWAITDQFPDKFENTSVATPAADLRSHLNHLLSEHVALAVLAMQKGIDGAEDFEAAAGALNENTDELTNAIKSVYGEEGAAKFKEIWSSHIGYFVDYVVATGASDEAAKEMAIKELDAYIIEQAKFLETATEGRLPAAALEEGLNMHVDELLLAFTSYVDKDYNTTYTTLHEAYMHMFEVGKGLSGAIVDQFPEKFHTDMPTEMPKTGLGGMSETSHSVNGVVAAILIIALISGMLLGRKLMKN